MKIVWDERKRIANLEKHKLDFADVDEEFFESAIITPARSGRYKAMGRLRDRPVAVIFASLGSEAISLISARPANTGERKLFDG